MVEIDIEHFTKAKEREWDSFIREESCNATFLQTRNFLNYHPEGKYEDCSLLFYRKGRLVGVCPASITFEDGTKVFSSHPGSTYGGIIVSKEMLRMERMMALMDSFEEYLEDNGFNKCILKQNNPLMDTTQMDLLEFCLFYRGFHEYKELNIYIDFEDYNLSSITSNYSKMKRRQIKKCNELGMELRKLSGIADMHEFIRILSANLMKYGLKPYHSAEDLVELKGRFPSEIEVWGALYENRLIAETMVFLFENVRCAHTHYLASDPEYNSMNPMTFIYSSMIERYANEGYRTLSWGITTEHLGKAINRNLTNTKEEFGSKHNVVRVFEKKIGAISNLN